MLVGIIGAPNKGKSTIFSALTLENAEIADYPFTTISPNFGIAYVNSECPEKRLGIRCNPRNSLCIDGVRRIPVNLVDVAGLVPSAHEGKGMGTQFLSEIMGADVIIQVVDLSGKTDLEGNAAVGFDPAADAEMVSEEMARWLAGIIQKHMQPLSKKGDAVKALAELLSGFNASEGIIRKSIEENGLSSFNISWDDRAGYAFSRSLLRKIKPVVIAANKMDTAAPGALEKLKAELGSYRVIGCSGALELALRKASEKNAISYIPGKAGFTVNSGITGEQEKALSYIGSYLKKFGSTGVQEVLDEAVFGIGSKIVVYPVENENRFSDGSGNVLPDAILLDKGATALDLARKIHSDIAERMLYAVDAINKMRIAKDHLLENGAVIKIVTAAR